MAKQPHNEHELELALTRLAGSNVAAVEYRDMMVGARLIEELGSGFTISNLKYMRKFYQSFPISHTLCDQLSWSHYRLLISVENEEARAYYLEEARKSLWSVRELQRQINSFYYERLIENRAKKRGRKNADIVPLKPIDKMTSQSVIRDQEQELIAELRRERMAIEEARLEMKKEVGKTKRVKRR